MSKEIQNPIDMFASIMEDTIISELDNNIRSELNRMASVGQKVDVNEAIENVTRKYFGTILKNNEKEDG